MASVQSQTNTGAPIRRRRVVIFFTVFLGLLFFIYIPWELPSSVKDTGISGLSRANVAQILKSKRPVVQVDEIYGLLHLVTGDAENQHLLSNDAQLDPTQRIDLSVYAAGSPMDWEKEVERLNEKHPIIVFSKTYCPYSHQAKQLLKQYDIEPAPKIVEVDIRDDGSVIKLLLTRLTNHSTFPNIIVGGKSIGGSDNLRLLHIQKELVSILEQAGAVVKPDGSSTS